MQFWRWCSSILLALRRTLVLPASRNPCSLKAFFPFHVARASRMRTRFDHTIATIPSVLQPFSAHMSTDRYFKALIPYSLDKSLWNSPFNTFKHLQNTFQMRQPRGQIRTYGKFKSEL